MLNSLLGHSPQLTRRLFLFFGSFHDVRVLPLEVEGQVKISLVFPLRHYVANKGATIKVDKVRLNLRKMAFSFGTFRGVVLSCD